MGSLVSKRQRSQPLPPPLGARVTHQVDARVGFVVGDPESTGGRASLVPVIVENSTRRETWPVHLIEMLPRRQQHQFRGGLYQPPSGYPLRA